jgi:hypothetical protein
MAIHYGSRSIEGTSLVQPNTEKLKTNPKGRVCAHEDCETKLSIYNNKDVCGVHEDYERVHPATWFKGTRAAGIHN